MPCKITRDVLEARLKCKLKAHLWLLGEKGQVHDHETLMKEARREIRRQATARMIAHHGSQDAPCGVLLDSGLLKRGSPLLLEAVFEDDDFSVGIDALLRVGGESILGGFHYAPVLFHEAEKSTPDLRVILAILAELLGTIQGKVPSAGFLFHGTHCLEKRMNLAGVSKQAWRQLRDLRESRAGAAPRLMLNDHCQACEFRQRCQVEATAKDDLSLLRGMGEAEIARYAKRGIFTVAQLACTFRPPRRMKKPEQRKPVHSHALQALAVRETKIYVLGSPTLPDSATRLYLDLEGDPERGFCYLAGVVVRDGQKEERHSFWIDSPAEEPALLGQFLTLAASYPDAWVYAYGAYEAAFLRRVGKSAGREDEVNRVLARTFNVLSAVHPHVCFPVHSNGLKVIASHLGFRWTDPEASGLMSLVWRRRWERDRDPALKDRLTTYNLEDCEALRRVSEFLYEVCPRPGASGAVAGDGVARVEEMKPVSGRRDWCRAEFAVPDFGFVNERAYFDYQRDRVYVRSSPALRKSRQRNKGRKGKRNIPVNRRVEISAERCPFCESEELTRVRHGLLARLAFDLRITRGGVRRWVTRFRSSYHHCAGCGKRFLPWEYLRLDPHCHGLKSWAMNQHVVRRSSLATVAEMIKENFGLPVFPPDVRNFKVLLARYYQPTYDRLLEKLVAGKLIHADETEVRLKNGHKGYVWVFTSLEEVVFMYRPSREGDFLHDLLKGFRGVLVSDFYSAYDSLPCPQQKCLVHLIRDLNDDIHANPWDEELRSLASDFGTPLRAVVSSIDEHGLSRPHLVRHKPAVGRFFESVEKAEYRSELAEGYRQRVLKSRDKLFTFIDHDGVPWNNNNAEHAIKRFAYYREVADGLYWEHGLRQYLVLLSLCLTCKYKGVSFLKFLLSRETDIDRFCLTPGRKWPMPEIELQPDGWTNRRRKRKQGWDEELPTGEEKMQEPRPGSPVP